MSAAYWIARLAAELNAWIEIVDRYLPWMETLTHPPDSLLRALGPEAVKLRRRALAAAPSLIGLAHDLLADHGPSRHGRFSAWRGRLDAARTSPRGWINWPPSMKRLEVAARETVSSHADVGRFRGDA